MPITIAEAVQETSGLARSKADELRTRPLSYLLGGGLAGVYVGVAVVLLLTITGPLASVTSPALKLVQGAVFGIALTLVVFAGAHLFTGENLFMLQGLVRRTCNAGELVAIWVASLVANFLGSIALAAAVRASGVFEAGVKPGKVAPADALLQTIVTGKLAASGPQLFWRAVLCNMLVCLGLWMATRTKSDAAKLVVLFWCLLAFIASGFEHSIANMTIFGLAIFHGQATWAELGANLIWTVPGNVVGGGVIVGLVYAYSARVRKVEKPAPEPSREAVGAAAQAGEVS
jgi:nitrite transporter NirC